MKKGDAGAKVPVTRRALVQRINRKLAKKEEQLRAARPGRWVHTGGGGGRRAGGGRDEVGDYYLIDFNTNSLLRAHVDPEELGRELEVLQPWERLAD